MPKRSWEEPWERDRRRWSSACRSGGASTSPPRPHRPCSSAPSPSLPLSTSYPSFKSRTSPGSSERRQGSSSGPNEREWNRTERASALAVAAALRSISRRRPNGDEEAADRSKGRSHAFVLSFRASGPTQKAERAE